MNDQELKKQIDEIIKKTNTGKSVNVNLSVDNRASTLRVLKHSATRVAQHPETEANASLAAGDAPTGGTFTLNLDAADDLTDEEIISKITSAGSPDHVMPLAASASLPRVVITRDEQRKVWILVDDCSYQPNNIDPHCTITARRDFETDLSSIPRVFWSIIAREELSLAAPLFHDLIYRCGGGKLSHQQLAPPDSHVFTRAEVDNLFFELMTKAGIPRWKRQAAFWAVRGFAGFAWKP